MDTRSIVARRPRARAIQRSHKLLQNSSPTKLSDAELLAQLLIRFGVRLKALETATALIARFGSIAEVVSAPTLLLTEIDRVSYQVATKLKLVFETGKRLGERDLVPGKFQFAGPKSLRTYCQSNLAFEPVENVRILYLTTKGRLIANELHQRGTLDFVEIYPREIVKRSFELSSKGFVMLSGRPRRGAQHSVADIMKSRSVFEIAELVGMTMHDHIIAAQDKIVSMKAQGHI